MKHVGMFEAKTNLSRLVEEVEKGEEVIITRHGKPVAKIVRAEKENPFTPEKIAERRKAMAELREIANRLKINATVTNARALLELQEGEFTELLWSFRPARQKAPKTLADVPATTPESVAMSKALKKKGFVFVGPTTAYALMQATGIVNDHLSTCVAR